MENYKVMRRLGKGAQGSVFLVQHLEDKQHYVLKKVECNDETEANKAFKGKKNEQTTTKSLRVWHFV